jgi:hypothetical protein
VSRETGALPGIEEGRAKVFAAPTVRRAMARITFEGLPTYSWPGGTIQGTFVLESDRPLRAADIELTLRGRELSQVTIQQGKSQRVVQQDYPFLDLASSFLSNVTFQDPEHIAPGTYRFPFQFAIPAEAEPSLETAEVPAVRGRFFHRPDGMYVEYELEGRVRVPWWVDPVDNVAVPVYSTRRVLGTIPPLPSATTDDHPSFRVDFDPVQILPGGTVAGSYEIQNPKGKHLESLTVRCFRHVEYTVQGRNEVRDGPSYESVVPLGDRQPSHAGRFQLTIPNTSGATGPFHGQLYRTFWMVHAEVTVELGFAVKVDGAFTPA